MAYIANAKSRVNVGDRLRDCRTEIYRLSNLPAELWSYNYLIQLLLWNSVIVSHDWYMSYFIIVNHITPCTDMVVLNVDIIWGRLYTRHTTGKRQSRRRDDAELRIRQEVTCVWSELVSVAAWRRCISKGRRVAAEQSAWSRLVMWSGQSWLGCAEAEHGRYLACRWVNTNVYLSM